MRPSITKIIWSDFASLSCLVIPAVVLAIAIEDRFIGVLAPILSRGRAGTGHSHVFFFSLAPWIAGLSLLLLALRLGVFFKCFSRGTVVPGVIMAVPVIKDRGTLRYAYLFDDQELQRANFVHRSAAVKRLCPGDHVDVVVQRDKPSRAFVKQLYASDASPNQAGAADAGDGAADRPR
jgi:hypothetical protein